MRKIHADMYIYVLIKPEPSPALQFIFWLFSHQGIRHKFVLHLPWLKNNSLPVPVLLTHSCLSHHIIHSLFLCLPANTPNFLFVQAFVLIRTIVQGRQLQLLPCITLFCILLPQDSIKSETWHHKDEEFRHHMSLQQLGVTGLSETASERASCCASLLEDIVNVSPLSVNYLLVTLFCHCFPIHKCTFTLEYWQYFWMNLHNIFNARANI